MSSAEKFCLRWNDFETNISTAFKQLREDKDFFDVTLACEDEQLEAHKVVLAACSPFFRAILKRNRHEHPLLYLKGIRYTDLTAVLNFMYHGEVNVAQEDLDVFLALAQDLQIKGLTQKNEEQKGNIADTKQNHSEPPSPKVRRPLDLTETSTPKKRVETQPTKPLPPKQELVNYDEDYIEDVTPVKREPCTSQNDPVLCQNTANATYNQAGPNYHYSEERSNQLVDSSLDNSMFDGSYTDYANYEDGDANFSESVRAPNADENKAKREELYQQYLKKDGMCWRCSDCDVAYKQKVHLVEHVEAKHLPNVFFICPHGCGYLGKSRKNIRYHVTQNHWQEQQNLKFDLGSVEFVIDPSHI